jgi:glycosyltransferase involved in cell wall biosynthesis
MKIAIVAPSPVPFLIGGAENLFWGLLNAINQESTHQAELIKLPSREATFMELIDSYEAFSKIDLSYFDCVISTKYPAWMIHHDRHVCYMQHRLRGLYDTYALTGLPTQPKATSTTVKRLLTLMERTEGERDALDNFFGLCRQVARETAGNGDRAATAFPGPLIRRIIHFLDGVALSPRHIHSYAAISRNVAGRRDYFPPGVPVSVIHHPSNLKHFETADYQYLFTAGRLDGPKRIAMLLEAMRYVTSPVLLKISGTGPDEEKLKALAAGDDRICFLGFINDSVLRQHYAHALAVPFFPYDEDYGLITIEAMMSRKPVLTTLDAGGPNEFVENYETGFSVPANPRAIAEKIDYFHTHKAETMKMGERARQRVQGITWEAVIEALVEQPCAPARTKYHSPNRKKMTVALTFPVFPPRGGGQSRVFHLYSRLAEYWDVELITFTQHGLPALNQEISPGLREIRIPKTHEHQDAERKWAMSLDELPVEDVVMPELHGLTPAYGKALAASSANAHVLVACHPYLLPALRNAGDAPVWYEAQDVEWQLKKGVLPDTDASRRVLASVYDVEKQSCQMASVIMVCSEEDGKTLEGLYGADPDKMVCVPNGVDLGSVRFRTARANRRMKLRLDLADVLVSCFMGSWHPPNVDAVNTIMNLAQRCPEMVFLIMGSVCDALKGSPVPVNVKMLGVLEDEEKQIVLECADLALNPMAHGSGTNLKMLDYFAAGVPVLSSPFGARGLGLTPGENVLISELSDFETALREFMGMDSSERSRLVKSARLLVESRFDWDVIVTDFMKWLGARSQIKA